MSVYERLPIAFWRKKSKKRDAAWDGGEGRVARSDADRDEELSAVGTQTRDDHSRLASDRHGFHRPQATYDQFHFFHDLFLMKIEARRKSQAALNVGLSPELIEKRTKRHLEELEVR